MRMIFGVWGVIAGVLLLLVTLCVVLLNLYSWGVPIRTGPATVEEMEEMRASMRLPVKPVENGQITTGANSIERL